MKKPTQPANAPLPKWEQGELIRKTISWCITEDGKEIHVLAEASYAYSKHLDSDKCLELEKMALDYAMAARDTILS